MDWREAREVLGAWLGVTAGIQESNLNGLPPKHQDVGDTATEETLVPLELLELLREKECPVPWSRTTGLIHRDFQLARFRVHRAPLAGPGDQLHAVPHHSYWAKYSLRCTAQPPECSCCLCLSEDTRQRKKRHRQRPSPESDTMRASRLVAL